MQATFKYAPRIIFIWVLLLRKRGTEILFPSSSSHTSLVAELVNNRAEVKGTFTV